MTHVACIITCDPYLVLLLYTERVNDLVSPVLFACVLWSSFSGRLLRNNGNNIRWVFWILESYFVAFILASQLATYRILDSHFLSFSILHYSSFSHKVWPFRFDHRLVFILLICNVVFFSSWCWLFWISFPVMWSSILVCSLKSVF